MSCSTVCGLSLGGPERGEEDIFSDNCQTLERSNGLDRADGQHEREPLKECQANLLIN